MESYDIEARYFHVLYEDSDSEEVDLGEMATILCWSPYVAVRGGWTAA